MSARIPSLTALRAFDCVARHLSFTRAADELCVTIPALSHHIKALEADLGRKLFVRLHRSIELTREGNELFATTQSAFDNISATWRALSGPQGTLKVSTGLSLMANWLSARLDKLHRAAGDVTLEHLSTFKPLDFASGAVDIAIRHGDQPDVSNVFVETMLEDWWVPMAAPSIAAQINSAEDLKAFPIIEAIHPSEPKNQPRFRDWCDIVGLKPKDMRMQPFSHTEPAMRMVTDGLGVKLCSNILAHDQLLSGELKIPIKTAIRREGFRYRLICREGSQDSEPIASIRAFFREEFAAVQQLENQLELVVLPRGTAA